MSAQLVADLQAAVDADMPWTTLQALCALVEHISHDESPEHEECVAAFMAGGPVQVVRVLQSLPQKMLKISCFCALFHVWGGGVPPFDFAPPGLNRIRHHLVLTAILDALEHNDDQQDVDIARAGARLLCMHCMGPCNECLIDTVVPYVSNLLSSHWEDETVQVRFFCVAPARRISPQAYTPVTKLTFHLFSQAFAGSAFISLAQTVTPRTRGQRASGNEDGMSSVERAAILLLEGRGYYTLRTGLATRLLDAPHLLGIHSWPEYLARMFLGYSLVQNNCCFCRDVFEGHGYKPPPTLLQHGRACTDCNENIIERYAAGDDGEEDTISQGPEMGLEDVPDE